MNVRAALADRRWRLAVQRMAQRFFVAVDPALEGLSEDTLAPAFSDFTQVMLAMRQRPAEERLPFFAAQCQTMGIEIEEGQGIWLGLLAWAEAHPPRNALLARLQQAYVESHRSWPAFRSGKLRGALMARALFYARQQEWRDAARTALDGYTGDQRGQALGEDLFLWMAGLVEWSRTPGERGSFLTTGQITETLLEALGIPAGEDSCLDGVLAAAGYPGRDPWDARLVRAAGLVMVSADQLLELVRQRVLLPDDRAAAVKAWEAEVGPEAEAVKRPWVKGALEAVADRLVALIDRHGHALATAGNLEAFEEKIARSDPGAVRVSQTFAATDLVYAWASLKDIVGIREPSAPSQDAGEGSLDNFVITESAVAAAWRYGRRLVGRDGDLGYRVLAPLVDSHWGELSAPFLKLMLRHPPATPPEHELVVSVLAKPDRARAVAEELVAALAKKRIPGRWPTVLDSLLARLPREDLAALLPRVAAAVCERPGELHSLLPGVAELHEKLDDRAGALDFCLEFFGPQGRGGPEALMHAARLARSMPDWVSGGGPVIAAARDQGELMPDAWQELLDLCTEQGRLPDALAVLLSWASHSITPRGTEKAREKLSLEWATALELAALVPDWDHGFGQVWTAALEASCPVPEVWRTLVEQGRLRLKDSIVREGSKRFVEAWGADRAVTQLLWDLLEHEVASASPDTAEIIDLVHWLHVDLGHNRWTSEEEFASRVVALPGVTPRALGEWALRKLHSSRRWALLGAALADDTDALDTLLDVVREMGHPITRALEGLVQGLPEKASWPFLIRLLPGAAWSLEWAWMEVLRRWKLAPTERADQLRALLPVMPAPQGTVTPAFERECRLFLGYLLASEPDSDWGQLAAPFQRAASGSTGWNEMLRGLVSGPRSPQLHELMVAELVEPLESEPAVSEQARVLRDRLRTA